MREIKFKVKIPDDNNLYEVITIEQIQNYDSRIGWVKFWDHPCARTACIKGRVSKVRNTDCILLQYTGLKDKNGSEIYEGDVVEQSFDRYIINSCPGGFDLTRIKDKVCFVISALSERHTEVIGNIYETPELLEATNEDN